MTQQVLKNNFANRARNSPRKFTPGWLGGIVSYLIGIDTGGTFTDCVIMDEAGKVVAGKSASTPSDFSLGILDSVRVTAESMGFGLEEILKDSILFSHAATTATNAVVTRRGAKTGLILVTGRRPR
jgi:N-methylhydantoinase A